MKKVHITLFILACLSTGSGILISKRATSNGLHAGVYQSKHATLDHLAEDLLKCLQTQDTASLTAYLPTAGEFVRIEKYLADPGQNPDAGRAIGLLMISENYKSVMRWMSDAKRYKSWKDPQISEPDSLEDRKGIEVIRGMQFSAVDSLGNRLQIPMFKTLLRSKDGYKIYTLLEPENH